VSSSSELSFFRKSMISLFSATSFFFALLVLQAKAFSLNSIVHTRILTGHSSSSRFLPFRVNALSINNKNNSEDNEDGDSFYRDLQKAKQEMLGSELPKEQLRQSAIDSENEFLQAMKESKKEYEEAKEQDESASEFFLRKIKEEEEAEERRQKGIVMDDEVDEQGFQ
jgi:hypothetical protein